MIDFRDAKQAVQGLIDVSLKTFAAELPDVAWSAFALYSCPWAGWVMTCFDTEAKSAEILAEFAKEGPDWYGEDEWGRFNNNCPDFRYFEWRALEFPEWQTDYEDEDADQLHVRDLSGQDHFTGFENEAINGLTFSFLRSVLLERSAALSGSLLIPRSRHRFGVQILGDDFVEFWRGQHLG